jgi:hypothetical protein
MFAFYDPFFINDPVQLGFPTVRRGVVPLGLSVERAAAALPQTAQAPLFTITGGRVIIRIIGEVTVAIQNQANNAKLVHNVAVGTDQDLCAVLNIAADEVGTLYTLPGPFASALVGSGQAAPMPSQPVVLKPGTIDLSTSASNTGAVKWTLYYIPIDSGALVVAA